MSGSERVIPLGSPDTGGAAIHDDAALSSALRAIRESAAGARVALHLRHDDLLVIAATEPRIVFGAEARRAPIDRGLAGRVAATRKPVYLADLRDIPRSEAPREPVGAGARTYLGIPLLDGDELMGVLQVDSPSTDAFPPATRRRIASAAEDVARRLRGSADDDGDPRTVALSAVAHELRTPLTSLRGLAETLARGIGASDRDLLEDIGRRIVRATDRLVRIVDDLFDLARSGLEGLRVEPEPVEVGPILERLAEEAPEGSPVWLDLELDLPKVRADPLRLRQALENLVANARRFSPPGSEVRLTAERVEHGVAVGVTDRGPGIPPDERERIFDPFVRTKGGGLGIGLALVRRIADAMDARIEVESAPGVGSTFRLVLPPV